MRKSVVYTLLLVTMTTFTAVGAGDVLQQLGVSRADATKEFTWSLGAGQLAFAPLKKAFKSASPAVRVTLVEQTIGWAKSYVASPEFQREWTAYRDEQKPEEPGLDDLSEQEKRDILQGYQESLKEFNEQYPADGRKLVAQRLREFLEESNGIDYDAKLVRRGSRMVFANDEYESWGSDRKACFRAGREPVERARALAKAWLAELH